MNTIKYKDMIMKYNYYKNVIIKNYIEQGVYPDIDMVNSAMNRINLAFPVLSEYEIHEGSKFDTDKYNETLKQIFIDLSYLYELTYDITVSRYEKLKMFLDSHLLDLQSKADNYYKRALIETNSTALGNTVLYLPNLLPQIDNNTCTIGLSDDLNLKTNSKIACFLNADNVKPDDIVFTFTNNNTGEVLYTPVYNDKQYMLTIPGILSKNVYNISFNENESITNHSKLILNDSSYSDNNSYKVYSGINKIIIKDYESGECTILDAPIDSSINVSKHSYIEFYILDGNNLSFSYNKKPLSANYQSDTNTIDVSTNNHIFLECDDDFTFNITISNGNVYAFNNKSIFNNKDHLLVTNDHKLKDFVVYEFESEQNTQNFSASVTLNNVNTETLLIDSIIIKELLSNG